MVKKLTHMAVLVVAGAAAAALFGLIDTGPRAQTASGESWFVEFERQVVPPIDRKDATQLIEVGSIETDGFSELVFSLGGEFRKNVPESGTVGVILIPDEDPFLFLLENEGEFAFPLEVSAKVGGDRMFVSDHHVARVAFPKYRAYLYNESNSTATVALYIYRAR